jgi:hypothetical protein
MMMLGGIFLRLLRRSLVVIRLWRFWMFLKGGQWEKYWWCCGFGGFGEEMMKVFNHLMCVYIL